MSTKNNGLVAIAALALGYIVTADASPVCDGLLNDLSVTKFGVAEVDAAGRTLAIVGITDGGIETLRPVADSAGNVKIFATVDAAIAVSKRAALVSGLTVEFVKKDKVYVVGDPLNVLKSKFKSFKTEALTAQKQSVLVTGKVNAAVGLGWDTAVGTPENAEYLDLTARVASIDEWKAFCDAKVVALSAALTSAGVDPLTVI